MAELTPPHEALAGLADQLDPVGTERVALHDATGRVLGRALGADRDSPPADVSAMDGYAVRLADLAGATMPIAGEVALGQAPPALPEGQAVRIFTGGCVPENAELVVPREDVHEADGRIMLRVDPASCQPGQHVRRQGENLRAGERVLEPGAAITPAVAGALSSFGHAEVEVHRRVKVAAIITGDELLAINEAPRPWQIRDANGPALAALLAPSPWIEWRGMTHVADTFDELHRTLATMLGQCDVVLLTGGVSMGDHDHVPAAVEAAGARIAFHKLAIRPGKPMLGGVGPAGQAIVGLPGNPVSVLVTARRFAAAVLRRRAGFAVADAPRPRVMPENDDGRTLKLWWYRPVRLRRDGGGMLTATMGSGDLVSAARSDGFVEQPPGERTGEPLSFWSWAMDA